MSPWPRRDAAMIIDAMDLPYSGRFAGFRVVSSDSDVTRLAARPPGSASPAL